MNKNMFLGAFTHIYLQIGRVLLQHYGYKKKIKQKSHAVYTYFLYIQHFCKFDNFIYNYLFYNYLHRFYNYVHLFHTNLHFYSYLHFFNIYIYTMHLNACY